MLDNETTGVLAAILAPVFTALGFIIWEKTWKESGGSAFALNLFKCNLASIGFLIASFTFGFKVSTVDEEDFEAGGSVGFLILSGFVGIIVGDLFWLESLRLLGASNVLVIDTFKPFTAALLGWLILDESIQKAAFSGIVMTAVGVLIVSLAIEGGGDDIGSKEEKKDDEKLHLLSTFQMNKYHSEVNGIDANVDSNLGLKEEVGMPLNLPTVQIELESINNIEASSSIVEINSKSNRRKGYVFAITHLLLDTYGSVLTKQHGGHFSTWTVNLIRFGSSGIVMIIVSYAMLLYTNRSNQILNTNSIPWYRLPMMEKKNWMKICIGVFFVTFLRPALSNYSLFQITLGLALTLGSISPLYAMLLEWPIHGMEKKPTFRSLSGASLAVGGVVIMSIFSSQES
jgi:drug/metabolite transporter (DMT)-like permease